MAVWHDHQPLARVRHRPDAVRLLVRQPCRTDQAGDGAEFVGREKSGQGRRLHRKRRLKFEQLMQNRLRGGIGAGQTEPLTE